MFARTYLVLLVLTGLVLAGCSPSPAPARAPASAAATTAPAAARPQAAEPTKAPAPTHALSPLATPYAVASTKEIGPSTGGSVSPYAAGRMIIKNGEMSLRVSDTNHAVDQVTSIAVDAGGYLVSSQTLVKGNHKYATLTIGVPVEQFEAAQRKLRSIAVAVLADTASGQDVSDQYVDLELKLTNLEATAARIRKFLDQAANVEEALKVNAQLTEIEGQINQIKGRANYLKDRSAFSTLLVNLEPDVPTPTPVATATPTATPTPVAWQPGETFTDATGTLGALTQNLVDAGIWLVVVGGPFALPLLGLGILFTRRRKAGNGSQGQGGTQAPSQPS